MAIFIGRKFQKIISIVIRYRNSVNQKKIADGNIFID